jgi:HTH-type transcriptional regulator / antitoxin HipB
MDYTISLPAQLRSYLQGLRKAAGWSQHELGTRVGLSQRSIAQIEAHPEKVSFDRIHQLLSVLGADLVVRTREPRPSETGARGPQW